MALAPTPLEIVDKLNKAINASLVAPKMNARFADMGAAPATAIKHGLCRSPTARAARFAACQNRSLFRFRIASEKRKRCRVSRSALPRAYQLGYLLTIDEETWSGDHLQFRVRALGQVAGGTIDVAADHVRLEVELPWLLAAFAEKITPVIRKEGTLLLGKK
jgi:hypothetical protein